jgi:hypothetical protein
MFIDENRSVKRTLIVFIVVLVIGIVKIQMT